MTKPTLPHGGMILIADGRKALFLRNAGDERFPNLRIESAFEQDNPATREQGADRPGRGFARAATNRRSSVETTDWHDLSKHRFAKKAATEMESLLRNRSIKKIIVVAPPRTLADLRQAFHQEIKTRIVAEIAKDLTRYRLDDIERYLFD